MWAVLLGTFYRMAVLVSVLRSYEYMMEGWILFCVRGYTANTSTGTTSFGAYRREQTPFLNFGVCLYYPNKTVVV